jgi:hypothetical protein
MRAAERRPSHGICRGCLAAGLRAERAGYRRVGVRFRVWDADARAGAAWARELGEVEAALAASERRRA